MDVVGTAFYVADMCLNFSVGFVVQYDVQRALVMEGRKVAAFYIRHGTFVVDFIASKDGKRCDTICAEEDRTATFAQQRVRQRVGA